MAIKTIFLDAGGTLIKVKGTVGEVYATTAKRHGFTIEPGHINGAFRQAFEQAPPLAFPGTPGDTWKRWEEGEAGASHDSRVA